MKTVKEYMEKWLVDEPAMLQVLDAIRSLPENEALSLLEAVTKSPADFLYDNPIGRHIYEWLYHNEVTLNNPEKSFQDLNGSNSS